ncbi:uncharacterized protein [Epargyreus clarus]|uniref:uncharacterized protein isoform X2 n=1 Tax=Epargyreus clarus TaxID=520877 RepID=UPI003C2D7BD8
MRRGNMGGGRGGGRGGVGPGGPLMTDHLKLRNLDRELELLRHKREVIQQEQHMLSAQSNYDRKRQFDCEPPHNMPHSYAWRPPSPKRFDPPQRDPWRDAEPNYPRPLMANSMGPITMNPNTTNPNSIPPLFSKKVEMPRRILPFNQGIQPLMKPVIHPILKKTITVRKDFNPPKVLKNRPFLPNKLNSYPVDQRKNLISKATGKEAVPAADLPVLREDQVPTQQMTGRLELALGSLVKELRYKNAHNADFKALVATASNLRLVKQAIRERIRSVMINQPVGSPADIISRYRLKYKKERDREIVELVLNTKNRKPLNLVESDDPEEFFKKNINTIIEKKLEEMFSNLSKMYTDARRKAKLSYTQAAIDANKIDKPLERETDFDEKKRADHAQKILRAITGKQITVEERDALNTYYGDLIANLLEEKITQLLPNYIKYIAQIFDLDQEYKHVKFMTLKRYKESNKEKKAGSRPTKPKNAGGIATGMKQSQEKNETEVENEADMKEVEDETNEVDEENESYESQEDETNEMDNEESEAQEEEMNEIDNEKTNTIDSQDEINETDTQKPQEEETTKMDTETVDKTMPQEKATTPSVEQKTSVDKKPDEVKVEKKVSTPAKPTPTKVAASPVVPKTPGTPSTPLAKDLPYYVKLIGRPNLPTRAVICDFLNKYRPKTIKKHKSINNLLVVGFVNREDYDKILTANETVIGDITIIIKASEPVNQANDTPKSEAKEKEVELKKEVKETPAQPSGNGLEEQINDLLSTIRKSDEVPAEKATPTVKVETTSLSIESTDSEVSKDSTEDKEKRQIEPIKEVDENGDSQESDKSEKSAKGPKESGRATPVRASSRLASVTPSTIRTRRASRLIQEQ